MLEPILDSRRPKWKLRLACTVLGFSLVAGFVWIWRMTHMPLKSYHGPLQPLSYDESEIAARLSADVKYLSQTIGERSLSRPESLTAVTDYVHNSLQRAGYTVTEQTYLATGRPVKNLEAILSGGEATAGVVIIGAHYDSVAGTVGADDNATGVAATLALAQLLRGSKPRRTIRFVLFVNEEPPYFQTDTMGSLVYARQLQRDHVAVSAMISLEMLGFYSDAPGTQKYPPVLGLLYPSRGDFIGFVGNPESRDLLHRSLRKFRESTSYPSEGLSAPADWPGVGWSDHWSFWQEHYPAIMITDTALFRNPYYHTPFDTADRVDFAKMARVVGGVRRVVESLAAEQ
jgi:Zn-dependent M28 family amino/carboxypeptidase